MTEPCTVNNDPGPTLTLDKFMATFKSMCWLLVVAPDVDIERVVPEDVRALPLLHIRHSSVEFPKGILAVLVAPLHLTGEPLRFIREPSHD